MTNDITSAATSIGPRASCRRCSERRRALGSALCVECSRCEEAVEYLAHAGHGVHTVRVGHMSTRLSTEQVTRIDRLVSLVGERSTFAITRSAVLRRVIERGLAVVEQELGLDAAPASPEESTYG